MKNLRLIIVLIFSFSCMSLHATDLYSKKKYNLSICSIINNEAKFLKEWIEYHRLIGVDHFYLYNVNSTDRYMEVIRNYIKEGVVTLIRWPDLSKNITDESVCVLSTHVPAYENAVKVKAINETNWLVFVEVNEFLVTPENQDLREILEEFKEYPGIILQTDYYDASNINPKKLIIETINLSKPPKRNIEKTVLKTIFKPKEVETFLWPPYQFTFKDAQSPITLKKYEMRINQYVNRKSGLLLTQNPKVKMAVDPRMVTEEEIANLLKAGYEIEDAEQAIHRFVPVLHKKMGISPTWD